MKYGVVIFPSKKLQDLANSYRKRYDPRYALIPPHITLREAFEYDGDANDFTNIIRDIAKKYEPIHLEFLKVSSFAPITNAIYFKIRKTAELEKLHKELYEKLPGDPPKHPFVPHVTIGQELSNDEHSDVYGSLRMLGIKHSEIADRIHLVYQLENGTWATYETFRLGKEY